MVRFPARVAVSLAATKRRTPTSVNSCQQSNFRELVESAFGLLGLDWEEHVTIDESLFRPAEAHELRGDPSKARMALGWSPRVGFEELVKIMVEADLRRAQDGTGS